MALFYSWFCSSLNLTLSESRESVESRKSRESSQSSRVSQVLYGTCPVRASVPYSYSVEKIHTKLAQNQQPTQHKMIDVTMRTLRASRSTFVACMLLWIFLLTDSISYVEAFVAVPQSRSSLNTRTGMHGKHKSTILMMTTSSSRHETDEASAALSRESLIEDLLRMLKQAPSNAPTSRRLTQDILNKVTELEPQCPTPDEQVLQKSAGNWELLWTTQDTSSRAFKRNPLRAWIKYV